MADTHTVRRLTYGHPLTGSTAPWSAEWASGHTTEASPASPWWRLGRVSAIGVALVLFADDRQREIEHQADIKRALAALQIEGPNHG
jgi:hypothetical protein